MKKILLAGVLGIGLFSACNDNYLEKYPLTSLTEQNAFLDYSNYKAYMYPCYELFTNTTIQTNFKENSLNSQRYGDWYAGLVTIRDNEFNPYAYQTITQTTSGGGWDFSYTSNPQLSSSASFLRLNVLSSLN